MRGEQRFGQSTKERDLIPRRSKRDYDEEQGKPRGKKTQREKQRRSCQKASLGGKFRGGQGGE